MLNIQNIIDNQQKVLLTSAILLALLLAHYIANFCIKRFVKYNENILLANVILSLRLPVLSAFYVFSTLVIISMYGDLKIAYIVKKIALVVISAWMSISAINQIENYYLKANVKVASLISASGTITKILIMFIIVVTMLDLLGIDTSAILTVGGVGGVALGFAGKDLFANFFGFLVIIFDQPFKIGDVIESPDRVIKGTVEKITWRVTKVITFDKRPIYIPNSLFNGIIVQNRSNMLARRIEETLRLIYKDAKSLDQFTKSTTEYLLKNDEINNKFSPTLNYIEIGKDLIDVKIICFTKSTDWNLYIETKNKILLDINNIAKQHSLVAIFSGANVDIYKDFNDYIEN